MEYSVVIIEGETLFRQALAVLLEGTRHIRVAAALADDPDAESLLAEQHPDVVLLSLDGAEAVAVERVRRLARAVPASRILGLTRGAGDEAARHLMAAGAAGLVDRSQGSEELITAIRHLATGGIWAGSGTSPPSSDAAALSEREREFVGLLARGLSRKEIARHMGVSVRTLETFRRRCLDKLGLKSTHELARWAERVG